MKNFSILNTVLLMLVFMTGFTSCINDDSPEIPPKNYKYLKEILTERKITKADIISGLDKAFTNTVSAFITLDIPDYPRMGFKLYHSQTDDFVPYSNATAAKNKWNNITLIDLTSQGHIQSGVEFMLRYMELWDLINKK